MAIGCSDDESAAPGGTGGTGGAPGPLVLTSTAFAEGETIPPKHGCTNLGGENVSPAFAWTGGPAEAKSYAIVMRDLDFGNGFLHWTIWDIPKGQGLPEGIPAGFMPGDPAGAKQAAPYFGPCSPGVNTYEFTVHALPDETLPDLNEGVTTQAAAAAIEAASLEAAKLPGES